jgi:hypothetical protein
MQQHDDRFDALSAQARGFGVYGLDFVEESETVRV